MTILEFFAIYHSGVKLVSYIISSNIDDLFALENIFAINVLHIKMMNNKRMM